MDCKEIEKLIPKFIKKQCSKQEEEKLIEHVKTCTECKEELTIQFLLEEGLNRLEAGESFDLNTELEKRLEEQKQERKPKTGTLSPEQAAVIGDLIGGAILVALIIGLLIGYIHL